MIVIATTDDEAAVVRRRLRELDVSDIAEVTPCDGRRLLVATVADPWIAEAVTATLRAEGQFVVTRPDDGPRLDAWIEHSRPLRFGDRLSVSFAWSEHDRRGLPGSIELGAGGWGHGDHPTTRLLIEMLIEQIGGGERVLDIGCGSGVLGLCALELGAAAMTGVDRIPDALVSTLRNAALNALAGRVDVTAGPLSEIEPPFDVIVANVGRAAIVELAPDMVRLLAPGGWLAVSGISPPQCTQVAGFLRPLVERSHRVDGEWAVVVLTHDSG
ncbi:MAG: 50S ribosomal protein L11 methyltransferase [Ilumatobacteraceae bacterium]